VTDPRSRGAGRAEDAGAARRRKAVAGRRAAARRALDARAGSTDEESAAQIEQAARPAEPTPRRFRRSAAAPAGSTSGTIADIQAETPEAGAGDSWLRTAEGAWSTPVKVLIGAALLAALVLLTLLALFEYQTWQNSRLESARTQALAAAQRATPDLLSYDYRHLQQDIDKAEKHLTGQFVTDYTGTMEKGVTPVASQYKVVVKAEVIVSSVVSVKPDEVVTLLFVNTTTTSTRVEGPRIDQNRVRMTLQKVDDRWLISQVDAL
jgi:Mce-associated membrane protein